jgi:hypothetical protein
MTAQEIATLMAAIVAFLGVLGSYLKAQADAKKSAATAENHSDDHAAHEKQLKALQRDVRKILKALEEKDGA